MYIFLCCFYVCVCVYVCVSCIMCMYLCYMCVCVLKIEGHVDFVHVVFLQWMYICFV